MCIRDSSSSLHDSYDVIISSTVFRNNAPDAPVICEVAIFNIPNARVTRDSPEFTVTGYANMGTLKQTKTKTTGGKLHKDLYILSHGRFHIKTNICSIF